MSLSPLEALKNVIFAFSDTVPNFSWFDATAKAKSARVKIAPPITMKAEKGVDSAETTLEDKISLAKKAAKRYSCTVMVTGSTDVIANGGRVALVSNGVPMMSKITGTGCLASGLVAALCGCTEDSFEAAVTAAALIGTVGEIASETAKGTGSLYVGMLDTLTNITPDIFTQYAKIENYTGE